VLIATSLHCTALHCQYWFKWNPLVILKLSRWQCQHTFQNIMQVPVSLHYLPFQPKETAFPKLWIVRVRLIPRTECKLNPHADSAKHLSLPFSLIVRLCHTDSTYTQTWASVPVWKRKLLHKNQKRWDRGKEWSVH